MTRLEQEVADKLMEIAATEKRSISAQVALIIERFVEEWKVEQQKVA